MYTRRETNKLSSSSTTASLHSSAATTAGSGISSTIHRHEVHDDHSRCATTSPPTLRCTTLAQRLTKLHTRASPGRLLPTSTPLRAACVRQRILLREETPYRRGVHRSARGRDWVGAVRVRIVQLSCDAAMNELDTGGVAATETDAPGATPQPSPITQRLVAVVEHLLHHKLDKWDHTQVCQQAR